MVASGMTPSMIRQRTGVSQRRLTLFLGDPSFNELISIYAKKIGEAWDRNIDAYLDLGISNMLKAEAQIADHFEAAEDSNELLPLKILDTISQGRADRFGYSKHTIHHHEHDFAAALDKAIARSGKGAEIRQIEGRAEPPAELKLLPYEEPVQTRQPAASEPAPRSFAAILRPVRRRSVA